MRKNWGFDTKNIDPKTRPQDNFYRYANGKWLAKNRIPSTESRWGTFIMLRYDTEKKLRRIVREALRQGRAEQRAKRLVAGVYASAVNLKRREALGTKPVGPLRSALAVAQTKDELLKHIASLHRLGIDAFFGAAVDQDAKRSSRYILYLHQSGLGMPDRDYYLQNTPEAKRVRGEYVAHIERLLALFGEKPAEAARKREIVMRIETRLARASMNKVDVRDPKKTYHKKTLRALMRHTPLLRWRRYLTTLGAGTPRALILAQPIFFKEVQKILKEMPLADLKTYVEWHLFNGTAPLLSRTFARENFRFYGTVLMGTKRMKPLWRRGLSALNGVAPEALGKLYVRKHFSPRAKRKMEALVHDLFAAYRERIRQLDWMSAKTKHRALQKLRMMMHKIGYPRRFRTYAGLIVRPNDFFGNMLRAALYEHRRAMRKLKKSVDRNEWFMSPQTVNAYFNPSMNEIVFPAAILQPPFFDEHADDAVNYGAIGYTIGHEITHGFDDQGSKFDGKGNLKRWWSTKDRSRFERKARALVKQFDRYEVEPGVSVNGKLTLGENIADLGGIAIALNAYQKRLKKTGRKTIDGFTPEQRFFLGCAQGERELARKEFLKTIVMTDPHSPAEFRINGPLSNFEPFYEAFGVKRSDGLWQPLGKRASIW